MSFLKSKKFGDLKLLFSALNPFNKFSFSRKVSARSHNVNFFLRKKISGSLWVAKLSRSLITKGVDFKDLNQRALLAYRLSKYVKTPIPTSQIIKLSQIDFSEDFVEFLNGLPNQLIKDDILITEFKGIPIRNFLKIQNLEDVTNLNEVIENFVFNLWIGNYDKKDGDYVVDQNGKVWSIDYNLLGPGFKENNRLALGAYAEPYDFEEVEDAGWCISEILINELKDGDYNREFFNNIITKIEEISESQIKDAMGELNFFKEGTGQNINSVFVKFLISRQRQLRKKVYEWCEASFPRGSRPKYT